MTRGRTLLFSRDPGAANQMVALYELMTGTGDVDGIAGAETVPDFVASLPGGDSGETLLLTKEYAAEVWKRAGLVTRDWNEIVPEDAVAANLIGSISSFLRAENIGHLVTGVGDYDDSSNQDLWAAARHCIIPSAAFMDNDSVDFRFTGRDGQPIFPDRVFTVDGPSAKAIDALGAPAVAVSGNLHIARLRRINAAAQDASDLALLRGDWGARPNDTIVLFASEAWNEMKQLGRPTPESEFDFLEGLLRRIESGKPVGVGPIDAERCLLVVRPHPRDHDGKYDRYYRTGRPRLVVSRSGTSEQAIAAADIVAGMTSMLLEEAEALGRPVFRLVQADD